MRISVFQIILVMKRKMDSILSTNARVTSQINIQNLLTWDLLGISTYVLLKWASTYQDTQGNWGFKEWLTGTQ